MFKFIKWLFGVEESKTRSSTNESPTEPEKIRSASPAACGCGRSPTGYCVGYHNLSDEEWAVHEKNPNKVVREVDKPATKAVKKTTRKADKKSKS